MALVDLKAVEETLPADGSLIDYDRFRGLVEGKIGMIASRSIAAARKAKMFTSELMVEADGSQKLYIRRAVKGEKRAIVSLSKEAAQSLKSSIDAATSTSRKGGA